MIFILLLLLSTFSLTGMDHPPSLSETFSAPRALPHEVIEEDVLLPYSFGPCKGCRKPMNTSGGYSLCHKCSLEHKQTK